MGEPQSRWMGSLCLRLDLLGLVRYESRTRNLGYRSWYALAVVSLLDLRSISRTSEIVPMRARSKGLAIAGSSSWLNAFAVSMATPPMLQSLKFGTYIL